MRQRNVHIENNDVPAESKFCCPICQEPLITEEISEVEIEQDRLIVHVRCMYCGSDSFFYYTLDHIEDEIGNFIRRHDEFDPTFKEVSPEP